MSADDQLEYSPDSFVYKSMLKKIGIDIITVDEDGQDYIMQTARMVGGTECYRKNPSEI